MKKNIMLLEKYISEFLIENKIHSSIEKQINNLHLKNGFIELTDMGDLVVVTLVVSKANVYEWVLKDMRNKKDVSHDKDVVAGNSVIDQLNKENKSGEVLGYVMFSEYGKRRHEKERKGVPFGKNITSDGDKKKSWHCVGSRALSGFGPILYEIGIEYISYFKDSIVLSDVDVSNSAQNVWKTYAKRGRDIEKYQFDLDIEKSKKISNNPKVKNAELDQITQSDKSDDIVIGLDSILKGGERIDNTEWSQSALSKGFSKKKSNCIVMMDLLARGMLKIIK